MKLYSFASAIIIGYSLLINAALAAAVERSDIPAEFKWKTEHIFTSVTEWQAVLDEVAAALPILTAYQGRFAGTNAINPAISLIEYNRLYEHTNEILQRAYVYADLNYNVAMSSEEWFGRYQQCGDLETEIAEQLAWFETELLRIDVDTLLAWTDHYPELQAYRKRYQDMFALSDHTLSPEAERVLALSAGLTEHISDVFDQLTVVDIAFPTIQLLGDSVEVSLAGWQTWRTAPDREARKLYFKALSGTMLDYNNTLAALLALNIRKDIFLTKARNYESTLERALAPTFVPEEIYLNVVNTTRSNTAPLQKFVAIRKRALGLDPYHAWDNSIPLSGASLKRYSWDEASALILNAMEPLGPEYHTILQTALEPVNGWLDPYAAPGKSTVPYSAACYGVHPFMLFNFDYEAGLSLDDVLTVAHESGHSLHSILSERYQPIATWEYTTFNAEVAAMTPEWLLMMSLLDEARADYKNAVSSDKKHARLQLLALLELSINKARFLFYHQALLAAWELEAHRMGEAGAPLTPEALNELYGKLLREWYGSALEVDEFSTNSWSITPHFFWSYLEYTAYAYPTSYAAAVKLALDIRAEAAGSASCHGAASRFLEYLKSGGSKQPVELLTLAGVDMTTAAPIEAFIAYFADLVDELDVLLHE